MTSVIMKLRRTNHATVNVLRKRYSISPWVHYSSHYDKVSDVDKWMNAIQTFKYDSKVWRPEIGNLTAFENGYHFISFQSTLFQSLNSQCYIFCHIYWERGKHSYPKFQWSYIYGSFDCFSHYSIHFVQNNFRVCL